jgi:UTP--glucose-1-phosphate uridylyltransferase
MAKKVRKAVIPAGGLGTRFLPITKTVPKELLPIGTKPTLQMVIEEAADAGLEEAIVITSPQKAQIEDYFSMGTTYVRELAARGKDSMMDDLEKLLQRIRVRFAYQKEAKGLGHAILCSAKIVDDEPFVVILPDVLIQSDVPCCRQLMDAFDETACSLSATEHTPRERLHLYGIYDVRKTEGRIHWAKGVVEKPTAAKAPSDLAVVGRYLFDPEIFETLERIGPGKGGEIQLADGQNALAKSDRFAAYEYDGMQFDTGEPAGFLRANVFYNWGEYANDLRQVMKELIDTEG